MPDETPTAPSTAGILGIASPAPEAPEVESPEVETPEVEAPEAETPEAPDAVNDQKGSDEDPVETSEAETPEAEVGYPVTRPEAEPDADEDPTIVSETQQPMPPAEMLAEAARLNGGTSLQNVYDDLADRFSSWTVKGETPGGGKIQGPSEFVMGEVIAHLRNGNVPMI